MSVAIVRASSIAGSAFPPSSKSAGHRALICAALAALQNRDTGASCRIARLRETESAVLSDDLNATLGALAALGVSSVWDGDALVLKAGVSPDAPAEVDCVESGSTLRFFLPIFAALGVSARFSGRGRLPDRPLGVYADCLPSHGAGLQFSPDGGSLPLSLSGRLTGGTYLLPGDVSSQFISGLLLALPLCEEDSDLRLSTPLESADYVHTLQKKKQLVVSLSLIQQKKNL